jgi:hypothetical protein
MVRNLSISNSPWLKPRRRCRNRAGPGDFQPDRERKPGHGQREQNEQQRAHAEVQGALQDPSPVTDRLPADGRNRDAGQSLAHHDRLDVTDPIGTELQVDRQMGQALDQRRDAALGMPGEGQKDLIDAALAGVRQQLVERAPGPGAGRSSIGGIMEHADQPDVGVLLGAQEVEEAGAGALVATDDRDMAGAELPDRGRLPKITCDGAVEHGEEAAAQGEPEQDGTVRLAPVGLRRPGEESEDGHRRPEARDQPAQRRERLQFPEADVSDEDAEQHEHGPDEAPDEGIVASIARAVRARGRGLDANPEQPEGDAVADEHEIADHTPRQPRREAALGRGGEAQPMAVLEHRRGLESGRGDHRGHLQSRRFPTGCVPTVRRSVSLNFYLYVHNHQTQERRAFRDASRYGCVVLITLQKFRRRGDCFGADGGIRPENASSHRLATALAAQTSGSRAKSCAAVRTRRSAPR